jgi:hypothetical protein
MDFDPLNALLSQQEMESAQKYSATVKSVLAEENVSSRKAYETFYNNLALFSGGTIALSVTYLGYLKNAGSGVVHVRLLIVSWACLLATAVLGLFCTFLHTHYTYYARMQEYFNALEKQKLAESEAVLSINVVNLRTDTEIKHEQLRLRESAESHKKTAGDLKKKSDRYYRFWRVDGFAARVLFFIGLFLLFTFATMNALQPAHKSSPCLSQIVRSGSSTVASLKGLGSISRPTQHSACGCVMG